MKKAGKLWILDNDTFFEERLKLSGDKFEFYKLKQSLEFVEEFDIAIDVGAHYGTWTRQLSKQFSKVLAFEGRKATFDCLQKNLIGYNNVTLFFNAIGHQFDLVNIDIPSDYKRNNGNSGVASIVGRGSTQMITIDSLNLDKLNYLKLDVEGYELFALRGAIETIKRCSPVIIYEDKNHSKRYGIKQGKCGRFLKKLGYKEVAKYPGNDFVYKKD